jgi:hypothetical protein
MQEDMELKSGSAVRSGPARSGNGGYESHTFRQKQQLEVSNIVRMTCTESNRSTEISKLLLIGRIFGLPACYMGICWW